MAIIYTPGNAKASQVLAGTKFNAGPIYGGVGTMPNMGDKEILASSAYLQEGYLSVSIPQTGDDKYLAVNGGSQFTYVDALHCSAKNIIMGFEMLGLEGTATSDATATAADIKAGAIAYSQGKRLVGTASVATTNYTTGTLNALSGGELTTQVGFKPLMVYLTASAVNGQGDNLTFTGQSYFFNPSGGAFEADMYWKSTNSSSNPLGTGSTRSRGIWTDNTSFTIRSTGWPLTLVINTIFTWHAFGFK